MDLKQLKDLVYKVNGAAIRVHKELGAGLLEKIYHKCLIKEFEYQHISFYSELQIPIHYRDMTVNADLFCDFLVENFLVVEIKSVTKILPVHEAKILTYMKLLRVPMGLIINFNCDNIYKNGQKTYVNEYYRMLS